LRTKIRFAAAVRAAHPDRLPDDGLVDSPTPKPSRSPRLLVRSRSGGDISKLAGREISRDVMASLKRHGLIDGAIGASARHRSPMRQRGNFLEAFGFAWGIGGEIAHSVSGHGRWRES
jgi:hypothetical protein